MGGEEGKVTVREMIEARIREAERLEIVQEQIDFLRTVENKLSEIDPNILSISMPDRSIPPSWFSEVERNVLIDLVELFIKAKTVTERATFLDMIRRVHTEKGNRKFDFSVSDYHAVSRAICPLQSST